MTEEFRQVLHDALNKLAKCRVLGEWFRPSRNLVALTRESIDVERFVAAMERSQEASA